MAQEKEQEIIKVEEDVVNQKRKVRGYKQLQFEIVSTKIAKEYRYERLGISEDFRGKKILIEFNCSGKHSLIYK